MGASVPRHAYLAYVHSRQQSLANRPLLFSAGPADHRRQLVTLGPREVRRARPLIAEQADVLIREILQRESSSAL